MTHAMELGGTTVDSFLRGVAKIDVVEPAPAIGSVLDDCYELRERLGAGGMGTVYKAYDRRLDRDVAIKVPKVARSAAARMVAMFEREARATARLCHPGIVAVHHVGAHRGTPFAVLELLRGETLAARLARRTALTVEEALEILGGVLGALAYAHERGVVHRDLTPRNVFLTAEHGVKLLDFGVSIERGQDVGTQTCAAGTPGYMSPEHAKQPDPRNDVWAAGVLFVECVTGRRPPFEVGSELPREVPARVRAVIARAIDRDPARRPGSAAALRSALALDAPARAPRSSAGRRRVGLAVTSLALLALAAVAVVRAAGSTPASDEPVAPRDGRWLGDPAAGTPWETQLQRIDATHFAYRNQNRLNGQGLSGTLTLERLSDGTTILSGKTADLPNCPTCDNVGFLEFIVLDETHIYQNRALWGKSHDNYTGSYPEYRYKWEGALRDRAR